MKTNILIRFDDICPTMDWYQWERAELILQKYHIKPLLGVIPDCQDPSLYLNPEKRDFWPWVKKKQESGYAIAMHGVYHLYRTNLRGMINNGFNSEFAGLSYEQQYEMIKYGKEILISHGIKTDIFFAPSHSYDKTTLLALRDNGFKYISDGKTYKPVIRDGIICIPCKWGFKGIVPDRYRTAVHHVHTWAIDKYSYGYENFVNDCTKYNVLDWSKYISRPCGNLYIQRIYEGLFVLVERHIYPIVKRMINAFRS